AVVVDNRSRFRFGIVESGRLRGDDGYFVLRLFFGTIRTGNPFARSAYVGEVRRTYHAVRQVVVVLRAVAHLHDYRGENVHILADPVHEAVFPVHHAEVAVLPRGAVDNRTVGRHAAGHDAYPELFAPVILVGHGKHL